MTPTSTSTSFGGWPEAALDFFEGLEADNSRDYWLAHKPTYDADVRAPMEALAAALQPEFGPAVLFRPYRDVRSRPTRRRTRRRSRRCSATPATVRSMCSSPPTG